MDYKIINKEEYMVLAKTRYITSENSTEEIPKFWSEYFGDGSNETVCGMLGICGQEKIGSKDFRYGIGCECSDNADVPNGFEKLTIPAYTWAIFKCVGPMPNSIQDMWKRIYSEWLPQSEYELIPDYCIELYTEGNKQSQEYVSEIWIPVKKKCKNQDNYKAIEVSQLSDNIWLMNDNGKSTGYIVVGNDKAAVIDTMYGRENIQTVVRTVTDLPLLVINTHGHPDHVYGNAYFDEVCIHPDDIPLAEECYSYPQYKKMKRKLKDVTFKAIEEGDSFDLGGITLEAYDIPGHTPGGICILDREDRVLFTGDSINRHCWMQLDSCSSMEDFYLALQRLNIITTNYDYILHGHAQGFEDALLYEEHMAAVKEVIDGTNTTADEDYEYFGGKCKIHYSSENIGIVYNSHTGAGGI